MQRFRFPLDPVLGLRKRVEEQKRLALAGAIRKVVGQQRLLAGWFAEDADTKTALRELKGFPDLPRPVPQPSAAARLTEGLEPGPDASAAVGPRRLDLLQIRLHEGYLNLLARRIQRGYADLRQLRSVEEEKRRALVRATQERRVLERLRERHLAAWRYASDLEERKFLDEVGQQGYWRARRGEVSVRDA